MTIRTTEPLRGLSGEARIIRDRMGVPHIQAKMEADAYLALGYAMAEDRGGQLIGWRRTAYGRPAEALGPGHVKEDLEARLVDFARLAREEVAHAGPRTLQVLEAFCTGVNQRLVGAEPWTPGDSFAVLKLMWWRASGRLDQIVGTELALRGLPAPLHPLLLGTTGAGTAIVNAQRAGRDRVGVEAPEGSSNWVVAGSHTASGYPLFASDPHNPFALPSQWYEAHLTTPDQSVAGIFYPGVPAPIQGRNRRVAWGNTNNICSVRDLYFESESAVDNGRTPRGPIVNELLPEPLRSGRPVSLRWTGFAATDDIGVALDCSSATTVDEFLAAVKRWGCPTRNYVCCDLGGEIAYQCTGAIPRRGRRHLGIRDAGNRQDDWQEIVTGDRLPGWRNPARGWVATANNAVDPTDPITEQALFSGSSYRADRIAELLDGREGLDVGDMRRMQTDTLSPRGRRLRSAIVSHLTGASMPPTAIEAGRLLQAWDLRLEAASGGAAVLETFLWKWRERVLRERLPDDKLFAGLGHRVSEDLLLGRSLEWLRDPHPALGEMVVAVFLEAVDLLCGLIGDDPGEWRWGALHTFDPPLHSWAVPGGWQALWNTLPDARDPFLVRVGPTHRLIADMEPPGRLLSASSGGASEGAGSPHRLDGLQEWLRGGYHDLWIPEDRLSSEASDITRLTPGPGRASPPRQHGAA